MKEIQLKELHRCIKFIAGVGCRFKIITEDGQEFGDLQVVTEQPKGKRGPLKYPYGALTAWFRPRLDINAEVGSVQTIECGEFDAETLRGSLCSELGKRWGNDTYTSAIVGDHIEILRTA